MCSFSHAAMRAASVAYNVVDDFEAGLRQQSCMPSHAEHTVFRMPCCRLKLWIICWCRWSCVSPQLVLLLASV
jgi:hypothetical protein